MFFRKKKKEEPVASDYKPVGMTVEQDKKMDRAFVQAARRTLTRLCSR